MENHEGSKSSEMVCWSRLGLLCGRMVSVWILKVYLEKEKAF